jgi:hypothetical protein
MASLAMHASTIDHPPARCRGHRQRPCRDQEPQGFPRRRCGHSPDSRVQRQPGQLVANYCPHGSGAGSVPWRERSRRRSCGSRTAIPIICIPSRCSCCPDSNALSSVITTIPRSGISSRGKASRSPSCRSSAASPDTRDSRDVPGEREPGCHPDGGGGRRKHHRRPRLAAVRTPCGRAAGERKPGATQAVGDLCAQLGVTDFSCFLSYCGRIRCGRIPMDLLCRHEGALEFACPVHRTVRHRRSRRQNGHSPPSEPPVGREPHCAFHGRRRLAGENGRGRLAEAGAPRFASARNRRAASRPRRRSIKTSVSRMILLISRLAACAGKKTFAGSVRSAASLRPAQGAPTPSSRRSFAPSPAGT